MPKHFFSIDGDKNIFDGLEISKETGLCQKHMGKYPVISVSLKGINEASYETAFDTAVQMINSVVSKVYFLNGQ